MSAQLIRTTVHTRLHVQILKVVLAVRVTLDTLVMVETATVSVNKNRSRPSFNIIK